MTLTATAPSMPHQIEHLAIDALIPYARNSRTHSPEQVAQIAASIREFGFTNPVLIDADGGLIAGHGRVMGARQLGLASVPCIRLGHLTDAQKRAYVIADNKLALNAGWDEEMLALELKNLQAMDYDLALTGFDLGDIEELLASLDATPEGQTEADAVPEVKAEAVSQPGDIWLLGKHRIMCGDSTDAAQVAVLMDGEKADMVFTDPPYGIDIGNQSQGKGGGIAKKNDYGVNEWDKSIPYSAIIAATKMADLCVLWGANYYADIIPPSSCWLVWDKDNGDTDFADCELAWTSHKKAARLFKWKWRGMIQEDMANKEKRVHPTQKPVPLAVWAFEKLSAGNLVVDLFSGSGTTLIAAEQTGRRCYAMELSPQYVDVAVRRWQQFTGKQAVHAITGEPFDSASTPG